MDENGNQIVSNWFTSSALVICCSCNVYPT